MSIRIFLLLGILFLSGCVSSNKKPSIPLNDGEYSFEHKYAEAEQSKIKSINVIVKLKGNHITVINRDRYDVFSKGVLEDGELIWHPKSRQWIIGHTPSDRELDDVGGCTDGPTVIDLINRIYWTC